MSAVAGVLQFPTNAWARWEAELLALASGHENALNGFRPQKNFRYPPAPRWDASIDIEDDFRRLILTKASNHVCLAPDLTTAIRDVLVRAELAGKTVLVPEPCPWEFTAATQALGCHVRTLARDPGDIRVEDFRDADGVLFSQPNRVDGFYYPDEMYKHLLVRAREANSKLAIVSEESASLFTLNSIAPGRLNPFEIPNSYLVRSLSPVLAPHGPDVAWSFSSTPPAQLPTGNVPHDVLIEAASLYSSFRNRQGAAFGEFQRKILLVQKGVRMFSDAFRPVLVDRTAEVSVWPEAGFTLLLTGRCLRKRGAETVARELARDFGIVLPPGTLFGHPEHLQLCFAATPKWLEGLGTRLSEAFIKLS